MYNIIPLPYCTYCTNQCYYYHCICYIPSYFQFVLKINYSRQNKHFSSIFYLYLWILDILSQDVEHLSRSNGTKCLPGLKIRQWKMLVYTFKPFTHNHGVKVIKQMMKDDRRCPKHLEDCFFENSIKLNLMGLIKNPDSSSYLMSHHRLLSFVFKNSSQHNHLQCTCECINN